MAVGVRPARSGERPRPETARRTGARYQRLADGIRNDIVAGKLHSGAPLKIRNLAARYGVSIIPVREALQQLQGEGLVVMQPNRSARVRRVDEHVLQDASEVLEALEMYLAMRFAGAASPHQIAMLEEVETEYRAAAAKGDLEAAIAANDKFHGIIANAARNAEVMDVIRRYTRLIGAFRRQFGYSDTRIRTLQQEHRDLILAFKSRDVTGAGRIAALHVRSSRDDLLGRLPSVMKRGVGRSGSGAL